MHKAWYQSKTLLTQVVALLAVIASYQGVVIAPEVQGEIVLGAWAIVNIILRLVTRTSIG